MLVARGLKYNSEAFFQRSFWSLPLKGVFTPLVSQKFGNFLELKWKSCAAVFLPPSDVAITLQFLLTSTSSLGV